MASAVVTSPTPDLSSPVFDATSSLDAASSAPPPPSVGPRDSIKEKSSKRSKSSESDEEGGGEAAKRKKKREEKKRKEHREKKKERRHKDKKKAKSVSFPSSDRDLRKVKKFTKSSILSKGDEEVIPESLVLDEASNDGAYQQAILESLTRPPSVSPPRVAESQSQPAAAVVEDTSAPPPPSHPAASADEFQFDQHGSNIVAKHQQQFVLPPPSAAAPTPFLVPPPVTFEAYMHYYFELSQHKIDRMHHPYHHVTIEAVDVIQFVRVNNCSDQPLMFVVPLSSPFYRRTMEYACHRDSNVSKLCEWLLNYFRPQQLGPNQVAVNIHTILIPEDTPGDWARIFT